MFAGGAEVVFPECSVVLLQSGLRPIGVVFESGYEEEVFLLEFGELQVRPSEFHMGNCGIMSIRPSRTFLFFLR